MVLTKRKLYLDSSILGFAINRWAPARRAEANLLLRQIRDGEFRGGYSFVLRKEIDAAPPKVAEKLRRKVFWSRLRRVAIRSLSKVHDLAERYCLARLI